ncbi:MAG TPA: GtrA family protein, partial [Patescibacteria group bacterium]
RIRNIWFFKKYPIARQFIKFCLVGVSNTVIDFGVYLGLTRLFLFWRTHFLIANFVAFSLAASWSYFLNKYWTFRDKEKFTQAQYLKFFLVSLVGLGLTQIVLYSLVVAGLYDLFAKLIAVIVVVFWNFLANKYWTFRSRV